MYSVKSKKPPYHIKKSVFLSQFHQSVQNFLATQVTSFWACLPHPAVRLPCEKSNFSI